MTFARLLSAKMAGMGTFAAATAAGQHAARVIAGCADRVLLALDYDGTIAPVVDDPTQAWPEPGFLDVLAEVSEHVAHIAVISGREIEHVMKLGGFADDHRLRHIDVLGQYGVERWTVDEGYAIPSVVPGVGRMRAELPTVLAGLGIEGLRIDDERRAVGVDARGTDDPAGALALMSGPLLALAQRHGLEFEQGRTGVELRSPRCDKGRALLHVAREQGAAAVVYIGDDLGDIPAFEALEELRSEGVVAVGVCSNPAEPRVAGLADVVAEGPRGVSDWLRSVLAAI